MPRRTVARLWRVWGNILHTEPWIPARVARKQRGQTAALTQLGGSNMEKMTAGLLGAVAALATMGTAQAATSAAANPLHAASYADLLEPVQNAVAQVQADDAARAQRSPSPASGDVELAQGYYYGPPPAYYHHHHHHHHHHAYYRHHHHHHHHHHNAYIGVPGVGGVVIGGR
jgi:hypothetical protein